MRPQKLGCALPLALVLATLGGLVVLLAGCQPSEEPQPAVAPAEPPPDAAAPPPSVEIAAPASVLQLDLAPDSLSVSGISSGGYMAQQLHFAHADKFVGAGVIAAGPYACASGSLGTAMARCMAAVRQPLEVDELAATVREAAAAGRIADPAGLANDRVWLFHGTLDAQIAAEAADAAHALYLKFVEPDNVVYVNDFAAAHHFPTSAAGHPCDQSQSPYIGACGYDAAGEILNHIYGPLIEPSGAAREKLKEIAHIAAGNPATLMERAYVYAPQRCVDGQARCRLHLVLHGCLQSAEKVGAALAEGAGYNRWADANDLVIVYPQIQSSPANPYGCWDWWGYTGPAYAERGGPQIMALMDLVGLVDCNTQIESACARLERDGRVAPPPVEPATARRRALPSRPMHHAVTNTSSVTVH